MSRFILASFALLPDEAAAHAFGTRYDLPLPLSLWLVAAGLTVALSFVVFALVLRRGAGAASYPRLALLRLHPLALAALRAVSVCVFLVLIAAGLFGTQDPFRNLAPAFVWIAWWIGFTYLSALVGDLWTLLNPWKALYPGARFGLQRGLPAPVGVWPAAALLLAFAWIEIVWEGNAVPANIAWLALGYSLLTWAGMFVFGREAWLASGEVFAVYFGFLARLAPAEVRSGEWCLRPPAAGLLEPRPLSSSEAFFVIVMLATVSFDGLRETPLWAVSDSLWTAATSAGLLATPCLFALLIMGVCALMRERPRPVSLPAFSCRPCCRSRSPITSPITSRLALARFSEPRTARRSQYPLAALMVAYTMLSLWILAQPIVESAK